MHDGERRTSVGRPRADSSNDGEPTAPYHAGRAVQGTKRTPGEADFGPSALRIVVPALPSGLMATAALCAPRAPAVTGLRRARHPGASIRPPSVDGSGKQCSILRDAIDQTAMMLLHREGDVDMGDEVTPTRTVAVRIVAEARNFSHEERQEAIAGP